MVLWARQSAAASLHFHKDVASVWSHAAWPRSVTTRTPKRFPSHRRRGRTRENTRTHTDSTDGAAAFPDTQLRPATAGNLTLMVEEMKINTSSSSWRKGCVSDDKCWFLYCEIVKIIHIDFCAAAPEQKRPANTMQTEARNEPSNIIITNQML